MYRARTAIERMWEILPGLMIWSVFILSIYLSFYKPVTAAVFVICFDLYWVLKAANTGIHLVWSYRLFQVVVQIPWMDIVKSFGVQGTSIERFEVLAQNAKSNLAKRYFLEQISRIKSKESKANALSRYPDIYHMVLVPFVDEPLEVLATTFTALARVQYDHKKIIIVLATEERVGEAAQKTAQALKSQYESLFGMFFITVHPDGLEGEIKGKSANAAFAVSSLLPMLEEKSISIDNVIVSNLDSDTVVHSQYFARVTYEFLLADKPYRTSYQPIAIYNNNIWDSPAIIRVISVSNSFWQFTESSRPDRLRTFSSHSMPLKTLVEVGFWKKDIINEDGYIFWQCYLHYKGDYRVAPLFLPISLDTCLADTFWQTMKNQYKQKRRWAYNVEYYPHLVPKLLFTRDIPFFDRIYKLWQYVEGDFNWATASILISTLGWLPLIVGGSDFTGTVLAYNLPRVTAWLMRIATFFLIFSIYINLILLPPRPARYSKWRSVMMYLQWFLVPLVSVFFGSLPAIEAQTRLMLGKYLEFWVTPKSRKSTTDVFTIKGMSDQ